MAEYRRKMEKLESTLVDLLESRPTEEEYHGFGVRLLLYCLRRLSRVYLFVIQTRLYLYRKGIFRHHTLGCQVISVGNLTVGGTGKTPVVEIFARELEKAGRKVAILSRGYKKKEPGFWRKLTDRLTFSERRRPPRVVSDGNTLLLDSDMSGDEPYMLASNLERVAVLVDKNRVKSGRYAIDQLGCDTLILDDGFQYLALRHWVEIVLVDSTNPFGNEQVLPRGLLREPVGNIRRADFIFLTKSDGTRSKELRARLRELNPSAEMIECTHCPRYLRDAYGSKTLELNAMHGWRVVALSGIAAPRGFERELEAHGAEIVTRFRFADHHRYTQQEIIDIINAAQRDGVDAIITTEKDAVRLPRLDRRDVPVYYLRVDIEILDGAPNFHECIARICFREGEDAA